MSMKMLRRLLFPPKCAACGELLGNMQDLAPKALCSSCLVKWDAQKNQLCHCCGYPVADCERPVPSMPRHGIEVLCKLVEYDPQKPANVGNRMIFKLKDTDSAELQAFLAGELVPRIQRQLTKLGQTPENTVLVWAPRSKRAEYDRGFDQSKGVCMALAKELGLPKPIQMIRRAGGRVQKQLGQEQRRENAYVSFEAVPGHCADLKGKCVILVDDVVTTGATLSACAAKLSPYKPAHIIAACVAVDTPKERMQKG